jgi:hypothetical protein
MYRKTSLAALAAAFLIPCAASAATFDFTGYSDGSQEVLSQTDGSVSFDATAGASIGDGSIYFETDQDATFSIGGINLVDYVVSTADNCALGPFPFVGCAVSQDAGIGVGSLLPNVNGALQEMLTFTFNQVIDFTAATFGNVDASDSVDVYVDGVLVANEVGLLGNNPLDLSGFTGTAISFAADALDDNFNIRSLSVSTVPLPAGSVLLLSGLGLAAAWRRKKA